MRTKKTASIRAAGEEDWPVIQRLLADAGLPSDDLGARHAGNFLVAVDPGAPPPGIAGVIGLEGFGRVGLLRSLAVDPAQRGNGIGTMLVSALEERAGDAGLSELWLLTLDAEVFFWKLDYRIVDRDTAPDAIRRTPEFTTLCPATAHLMHKPL